METQQKEPRGFAAMTPEQRRAISQKGGRAARDQGTAHRWTSEEASLAARKGRSHRWAGVRLQTAAALPGELEGAQ